ncbi:MAG: hypothetical protein Q8M26_06865 [Pseudolabrys sp.]|nr:hypothetical protein [Pseudolabrys sp.]
MSSNVANETLAAAETPGEDDYQAFYAVLAESERGRAFLAEHARRARQADTAMLVEAFERLETRIAAQLAAAPVEAPAAAPEAVAAAPVPESQPLATAIPEVMLFEAPRAVEAPAPPAAATTVAATTVAIVETVTETAVVVEPTAEPPRDPLAAVMALTDDERIALFT